MTGEGTCNGSLTHSKGGDSGNLCEMSEVLRRSDLCGVDGIVREEEEEREEEESNEEIFSQSYVRSCTPNFDPTEYLLLHRLLIRIILPSK